MKSLFASIVAAGLAAGCATQHPQTADEFRRMAPGAFLMKTETVDVKRSVREIGETFRRRAPECLNMTIRTTSQTSTSYQVIDAAYRATVVADSSRAELHVQRKWVRGVIGVGQEPEGGHFLLVADVTPAAGGSRLQITGPSRGHDVLWRAINAWAAGTSQACPDLTKIG